MARLGVGRLAGGRKGLLFQPFQLVVQVVQPVGQRPGLVALALVFLVLGPQPLEPLGQPGLLFLQGGAQFFRGEFLRRFAGVPPGAAGKEGPRVPGQGGPQLGGPGGGVPRLAGGGSRCPAAGR